MSKNPSNNSHFQKKLLPFIKYFKRLTSNSLFVASKKDLDQNFGHCMVFQFIVITLIFSVEETHQINGKTYN